MTLPDDKPFSEFAERRFDAADLPRTPDGKLIERVSLSDVTLIAERSFSAEEVAPLFGLYGLPPPDDGR